MEFEGYLQTWDAVCSDWEVRFLDGYNDYTGEDIDYHDVSLTDLVESLDDDPRMEYQQAEIWALNDDGACDEGRGEILFWDGNAWNYER